MARMMEQVVTLLGMGRRSGTEQEGGFWKDGHPVVAV